MKSDDFDWRPQWKQSIYSIVLFNSYQSSRINVSQAEIITAQVEAKTLDENKSRCCAVVHEKLNYDFVVLSVEINVDNIKSKHRLTLAVFT